MTITAHTPQYTADGSILLQAQFPWLSEEVPFSASPEDSEAHGRELYQRAIAGEFGPIAAYVAPEITPAQRIAQIKAELSALDTKSIRALREGNQARLNELEAQAVVLRAEMVKLSDTSEI